jgi:hypothetical protein
MPTAAMHPIMDIPYDLTRRAIGAVIEVDESVMQSAISPDSAALYVADYAGVLIALPDVAPVLQAVIAHVS